MSPTRIPSWAEDPQWWMGNQRPLIQIPQAGPMPQMNQGPMTTLAVPQMPTPPPPSSEGLSDLGDQDVSASPDTEGAGDQPSLVKSALGKIFSSRGLAALGIGLQGLGGPQGQNPLLQRMVLQRVEQQRKEGEASAGLGKVFEIMSAAGQAPTAAEAQRIYDAGLRDPAVSRNFNAAKLLIAGRTPLAERAIKEGTAGKAAAILGALPEDWMEEEGRAALGALSVDEQTEKRVAGRPKRYLDKATADGQPIRIDMRKGLVQKAGDAGDWQKIENVNGVLGFTDRATKTWTPFGGAVKSSPNDRIDVLDSGGRTTGVPLVDRPGLQPIDQPTADALSEMGYSAADIQRALADPKMASAAIDLLGEAAKRKRAVSATPKPSLEGWAAYKAANPTANYRDYETGFASTGPPVVGAGAGATESRNYVDAQSARRIRENEAIGAQTAKAKMETSISGKLGPEASVGWMHKSTLQPPDPNLSADEARRAGHIQVLPAERAKFQALPVVTQQLSEVAEVIQRRKDLWPKSTGNAVADAASVAAATAKFHALNVTGTDPDVAVIARAQRLVTPQMIRFFGEVGNLAQNEQESAAQAMALRPSTDAAAMAQLGFVLRVINAGAKAKGLDAVSIPGLTAGTPGGGPRSGPGGPWREVP